MMAQPILHEFRHIKDIYLIEVVFVVHLVDRTHQIFHTLKAEVNF